MSMPTLQLARKWMQLSHSPVRDQSALVKALTQQCSEMGSLQSWGLIEMESWCITIAESESSEEA